MEAWNFLLAGGALFNNLDYSFTAGREDGTFIVNKTQPGGGGKTLRNQFRIMSELIKSFDFVNSSPLTGGVFNVGQQEDLGIRALKVKDEVFVAYFCRKDTVSKNSQIEIDLPAESYLLVWTDTKTGKKTTQEFRNHKGGRINILTPAFSQDVAMLLKKSR